MSNSEENSQGAENTARIYEAGFHLLPTLSASEATDTVAELKKGIEEAGYKILSEETPSRITLAYPIEKVFSNKRERHQESYFGWIKFTGEGEELSSVEELLKNHANVLRSLVVKTVREDVFYKKDDSVEEDSNDLPEEGGKDENTTEESKEDSQEKKEDLDESVDELVVK